MPYLADVSCVQMSSQFLLKASFLEFRLHSKLSSRHIISNLNFGYTLSDKRQIMSMDALSRS